VKPNNLILSLSEGVGGARTPQNCIFSLSSLLFSLSYRIFSSLYLTIVWMDANMLLTTDMHI
jgi:hypothetical protein